MSTGIANHGGGRNIDGEAIRKVGKRMEGE
jgi:hypothetical protein